jgi:hypothetical protein
VTLKMGGSMRLSKASEPGSMMLTIATSSRVNEAGEEGLTGRFGAAFVVMQSTSTRRAKAPTWARLQSQGTHRSFNAPFTAEREGEQVARSAMTA